MARLRLGTLEESSTKVSNEGVRSASELARDVKKSDAGCLERTEEW